MRTGVTESWEVIERVLRDKTPDVYATLRPGASESQLDRIESKLEIELPESFREIWSIHDGQDDPTQLLGLFNYAKWLSTDEIIENYLMFQELFSDEEPIEWVIPERIQNRAWVPGWVKFTEENGNGFVLDLSPTEKGDIGQVFYRRNSEVSETILAVSFGEFIHDLAKLLQDGEYEVEDGLIVSDQMW